MAISSAKEATEIETTVSGNSVSIDCESTFKSMDYL